MAKKKNNETVKPSGLTITRSGTVFTFKWKRGDTNYTAGQQLQYRLNGGAWTNLTVAVSAVSATLTNANVTSLVFRVRGCRKKYKKSGKTVTPTWSAWVASPYWTTAVPKVTQLTYDNESANAGTFEWKVEGDNTGKAILVRTEMQTCYVRNTAEPSATAWGAVQTVTQNGSRLISEDTEALATSNLFRWFRIRSVTTGGRKSAWKAVKHAYGDPNAAELVSATADTRGSVTRLTAVWNDSYNALTPIDKIELQYVTAKPTDTDLTAPSSGWQSAIEVTPNGAENKVVVNIESVLSDDECMWVRIKGWHDDDNNASFSNELVAQVGTLVAPTISAVPDTTTGDVTITITENTTCTAANTAIFFRAADDPSNDRIIAIFPRGTTTGTVTVDDIIGATTTCFGAYAFVGEYDDLIISDVKMRSATVIDSDIASVAPATVTIMEGPIEGTVRIGWEWSWDSATKAELTWADNEYAWESTDAPASYTVNDLKATSWIISGLEVGKRWYFRVRLIDGSGDSDVLGPWSDLVSYNLTTVPDRPVLNLSKTVINEGGSFVARWAFGTGDGIEQDYAEISLVTFDANNDPVYSDAIAHVDSGQSVVIEPDWTTGATYYLAVRITTTSGMQTTWSEPVSIYVAEPVSINAYTMSTLGFTYYPDVLVTEMYDSGTGEWNVSKVYPQDATSAFLSSWNVEVYNNAVNNVITETLVDTDTEKQYKQMELASGLTLSKMPFLAYVSGAGASGTTTVNIIRADDYHIDRPDDTVFDGYAGETIATYSQTGDATSSPVRFTVDDLVGHLDDGASYILEAIVTDEYGQTASVQYPFTVNWYHKATAPTVNVSVDKIQRIALITPIAPADALSSDTCDIYRITSDQPELIVKGAEFGTTYVDPYPAFGETGGHRLVTITGNGDYVTADGLGWYDSDYADGDILVENQMVIDVNGDQIELPYDLSLSNKWNKDFKRTSYLGGSVQGDWNPAVTRDLSADTVLIRGRDLDRQLAMRDLAGYAGVAHVRTPDGSSLTADVQIDEQQAYDTKKISYTLTIKAIDPQDPVGMTLDEWNQMHPIG